MKLLIDIGNTSTKLAIADASTLDLVHFERLHESWKSTLHRLVAEFPIDAIHLSTVAGKDQELLSCLDIIGIPHVWLTTDYQSKIKPITNIPSTYGVDRYAADMGAVAQDPHSTLLVIDAGTCITYDLIASDGRLLGGAISPGVQLRLDSMHEHTAQLPALQAIQCSELMGNDTATCMISSAVNGTLFEMEGYIRRLCRRYPDLHVFITGGNHLDLPKDLPCSVTFDSNLLFKGLAVIQLK